jgi:hypothetical protein
MNAAHPIRTVPTPVRVSRLLLALVGLSHLVVPLVMVARKATLHADIAAQHPGFRAAELDRAVTTALASAAAFHAILLLLCGYLVVALPTGRPRAWRLALISQGLGIVFSIVSWTSNEMFHAVIPVLDAVQVVIVVLLLTPAARAFFSATRGAVGAPSR